MMEVRVSQLAKGQRITGADRLKLGKDLKKQYAAGASIRELAAQTSRSYGFVHRVLTDEGVTLRGRGGATRSKSSSAKAPAKSAAKSAAKSTQAKPAKATKAKTASAAKTAKTAKTKKK